MIILTLRFDNHPGEEHEPRSIRKRNSHLSYLETYRPSLLVPVASLKTVSVDPKVLSRTSVCHIYSDIRLAFQNNIIRVPIGRPDYFRTNHGLHLQDGDESTTKGRVKYFREDCSVIRKY